MKNIREILAKNLRENRRRLNISQPKLAELAGLSAHFVASIETTRKFPTPDVLERLAAALGIDSHELFTVPKSPEDALEKLHKEVITDIKQVLSEAVKMAVKEQCDEYKSMNKNQEKAKKK
jgi:transcriptional regulator with XRE-family HTH domain